MCVALMPPLLRAALSLSLSLPPPSPLSLASTRLSLLPVHENGTPSLACATAGGKVLVHDAFAASEGRPAVRFLSFNKRITALESGALTTAAGARDLLFVGTETSLLAHDVERNADVFCKDVPDGVHSLLVMPATRADATAHRAHAAADAPAFPSLVVAGGNCSIQGFDVDAAERFWTVSGDHVRALAMSMRDGGEGEMIVGSDDFAIRVFKEGMMVSELTEAAPVVALAAIDASSFCYGLANGTVGVYRGAERAWRTKSRAKVTALVAMDIDGDGVAEIISGWSNGRVEIRRADGKLLHSETTTGGVAVSALLVADYRQVKSSAGDLARRGTQPQASTTMPQLIVCAANGEVRGFAPLEPGAKWSDFADAGGGGADAGGSSELEELLRAKRELARDLKAVQRSLAGGESSSAGAGGGGGVEIAAGTNPSIEERPRGVKDSGVELLVRTNSSAVVRSVVVLALDSDATFDGESHVVWPSDARSEIALHLAPRKDGATELELRIFVSARSDVGCSHHRVYMRRHQLPCFSMYAHDVHTLEQRPDAALGSVDFNIDARVERVAAWASNAFGIASLTAALGSGGGAPICLVSMRDGHRLWLHSRVEGRGAKTLHITLRCDALELGARIVQDMAASLQLGELESRAAFPRAKARFEELQQRVAEHNAIRLRLTSEMADCTHLVKGLVVRAEDARMLGRLREMRKIAAAVFRQNEQLLAEHSKRETNHRELLAALKDVNILIQLASDLRVGGAKMRVVAECRAAVKARTIGKIWTIVENGAPLGPGSRGSNRSGGGSRGSLGSGGSVMSF